MRRSLFLVGGVLVLVGGLAAIVFWRAQRTPREEQVPVSQTATAHSEGIQGPSPASVEDSPTPADVVSDVARVDSVAPGAGEPEYAQKFEAEILGTVTDKVTGEPITGAVVTADRQRQFEEGK